VGGRSWNRQLTPKASAGLKKCVWKLDEIIGVPSARVDEHQPSAPGSANVFRVLREIVAVNVERLIERTELGVFAPAEQSLGPMRISCSVTRTFRPHVDAALAQPDDLAPAHPRVGAR